MTDTIDEARFRGIFAHLGAVTAYAKRRGSRDPWPFHPRDQHRNLWAAEMSLRELEDPSLGDALAYQTCSPSRSRRSSRRRGALVRRRTTKAGLGLGRLRTRSSGLCGCKRPGVLQVR